MALRTSTTNLLCSFLISSLVLGAFAADLRRPRQQLRILAVGDSLTEGSVPTKGYNHPYTIELKQQLEDDLQGTRVYIDNDGVGGAGIYARGFRRSTTIPPVAESAIQSASNHNRPYNYVIVMLGINDLLREGKSADDVKWGLQQIYSKALNAGSNVIAIPPFPAPGFVSQSDYKEGQRKTLADLIKQMAADFNGKQSAHIIVMDLEADRFNFYNMDSSERSRWLDDGLHLTEMAYNTLGRQIARVIENDYGNRR